MMVALFVFCSVIGILSVIVATVGSTLYDIREIRYKKTRKSRAPAPKVALAISCKSNDDVARAVLLSQIPYKKLLVIIINQSNQTSLGRAAARSNSSRIVVTSGKKSALDAAVRTCKKYNYRDSLIVMLGQRASIDKTSLDEIVWHMTRPSAPTAGILNRYFISHFNIGGVLLTYRQNLVQITHKTRAGLGLVLSFHHDDTLVYKGVAALAAPSLPTDIITDGTAFVPYQGTVWKVVKVSVYEKVASWQHHLDFGKQKSLPATTKAWLDNGFYLLQQLALLLLPVLVGYFIYLGTVLHQPMLLFVSFATALFIILFAVWSDSQFEVRDRLYYTALLPVACLFLPLWLLLPLLSLLKMLADMIKAKLPRCISLFTRIKYVLRVI